jgi:hypothetical protein
LFNQWVNLEGIRISNFDEAIWVIEYIKTIQNTNIESLNEARKIDKIKLEKEFYDGQKVSYR